MTVTLESLWTDAGFSPNPKQREAILHAEGPLYLTAGPGSGKTSVLVWRTLNLIVFHEVSPTEIFLGTFTEKGAHQLRERLRGLLAMATERTNRPYDISRMAIGTIHSICHALLLDRRLSPVGVRPRAPILLDQFAQYQFVYATRNWDRLVEAGELGANANSQIVQFFENRPSTSRHRAVSNAIAFFNRLSEESVDPGAKRPREPMVKTMLKMYAAYRELLVEDPDRPRTDLSLLQSHAHTRVSEAAKGDRIFRHVIVDEYQDTNAIQEKIYFRLAGHSKNLCVVGDDDQALYRFRGATVDNFLAFPERCQELLKVGPTTIPLVTNYRSRKTIVDFYNRFMGEFGWKVRGRTFRVDKTIEACSTDARPAVFTADPASPTAVAAEVSEAVKELLDSKRVKDPNEIAFLFPSLTAACVGEMKDALEARGLKVYAPRAGSFIEQEESLRLFGTYLLIFGNPGHQHREYLSWLDRATKAAKDLVKKDRALLEFIQDRQREIEEVVNNERALLKAIEAAGLVEDDEYAGRAPKIMAEAKGLSVDAKRFLGSGRLLAYVAHQRKRRPDRPITIRYVMNRACSLDWGVLDLFYQLTTFACFKEAFDLAEAGTDEGPICNLSLISDYLSRFQDDTSPVISAQFLSDRKFARKLFASYLYSIFRLDEGEYEDKEDPFPKGRIPFLTVHQAKGLEFPVVVLGNLRKDERSRPIDELVANLGVRKSEPLDRAPLFDIARMFYVGLSRAKQVLILCPFKGRGQHYRDEFKSVIEDIAKPLSELDPNSVDSSSSSDELTPRPYSFTGDYIQYKICPRRYMLHRRYNFVPSRSQTTIFGNLVHRTIEDLHQFLISQREQAGTSVSGVVG